MSAGRTLPVVAYLPGRHDVSCARFDPVPGACDCGAEDRRTPLVEKRAAEAIIAELTAQLDQLRKAKGGQA